MDMSIRFPGLNLVLDHVPRSFEIFGFEITIYGVLIAIGMLLGIFFVVLEARRNHEDPDAYLDLAIITLLSGVAGARLLSEYTVRRTYVLWRTSGRCAGWCGLLQDPKEILLADGRSCLHGTSDRADNRKVGKLF